MKTMIDLPESLLRKARATATLEGIKREDLTAESLRMRSATIRQERLGKRPDDTTSP